MTQEISIPFHIPYATHKESEYLQRLLDQNRFAYPSSAHQDCISSLQSIQDAQDIILTGACTAALEIGGLLLDIQAGDEVILPSFAYPSMANAFVLRGAKLIFVDIDPFSMNIDPTGIAKAITARTKAIIIMHYGSIACDMENILAIAEAHAIPVIEDAAHCIGARFNNQPLGTFGIFGTLSFHFTKNIHCIQGGALLINEENFLESALSIAQKGTDKARMTNGLQKHYSWVSLGSSYLMNSLNAAFLASQLAAVTTVNQARLTRWHHYQECFLNLGLKEQLALYQPPPEKQHNAHLFFIKCADKSERTRLIEYLKTKGIQAYFHYLPLHLSKAGQKFGAFCGKDKFTAKESERLLRLPIYPSLSLAQIEMTCDLIDTFYKR